MRHTPLVEIAVITSNRPYFLRRCLLSYARHCEVIGRRCNFTIFDDTRSSIDRRRCREWLRGFSREHQLLVRYADLESKQYFADRMKGTGISRAALGFALAGFSSANTSPGRNRNAALLYFVDELFFCSDDDVICLPSDFRNGNQSLSRLMQGSYSLDTYFLSSRRAALEAVPKVDCDVLAMHGAFLGQKVGQSLLRINGVESRQALPSHGGRNDGVKELAGSISVTVSGVIGDSGIPNNLGFMVSEGLIRERFLKAIKLEESTSISRNVVRGVCRPSVAPTGLVFTTTGTGFDNRRILPPFAPSGAGEDTLFGTLLHLCDPHCFSAHMPVGLVHAPRIESTYAEPRSVPNVMQVLMALMSDIALLPSQNAAYRLRAIGQHLQEIAELDDNAFRRIVVAYGRRIMEGWIDLGSRHLSIHGSKPKVWAETMQRWLARLSANIAAADTCMYSDLSATSDLGEDFRVFQKYLLKYAALLQGWPDIVAASRELRRRDCRIAGDI